jgi:hypothetical protein
MNAAQAFTVGTMADCCRAPNGHVYLLHLPHINVRRSLDLQAL